MSNKQYQIFPAGYWEGPRLDPKRQGDPSVVPIYCAVGAALTAWEQVEEALALLYLVLTDCKDSRTANAVRRSFGVIESNAVRRSMIEAAAETYFDHAWTKPGIKKPFEEILKAVMLASHRRNEIAHGKTYGSTVHSQNPDGMPKITTLGAFLFAPEYMTARQKPWLDIFDHNDPLNFNKSKYRYTSLDINLLSGKFSELMSKIFNYIKSINRNSYGIQGNVMALIMEEAETRNMKQPR